MEPFLAVVSRYLRSEAFKVALSQFNQAYYQQANKQALSARLKELAINTDKVYKVAMLGAAPLCAMKMANITVFFLTLLQQIALFSGLKYRIVNDNNISWDQLYSDFLNQKVDIILPISPTATREMKFHFSQPFYHLENVMIKRVDDNHVPYRSVADLVFEKIGVIKNSIHDEFFTTAFPKKQIEKYTSKERLIPCVKRG